MLSLFSRSVATRTTVLTSTRRSLVPSQTRSFCGSSLLESTGKPSGLEEDVEIKDFAISEETLKKVDGLTEEEVLKKKSLVRVTANVGDRSVVCYGGVAKWYEVVDVEEVPENDTWTVTLDGRMIITLTEKGLYLPTKEVAMLVASDWEAQEGLVSFAKLPLMAMACKAIDDVATFRNYNHKEMMSFFSLDHACFRHKKGPTRDRQEELLTPITTWFMETLGLPLHLATGLSQNHRIKTIDTIEAFLYALPPHAFMYFFCLVGACKSLVLAMALWHARIDVATALACVRLEEDVQIETNGFVEGAHDYHGTLNHLDLLAPTLLLRAAGVLPPTKESLEAMGDSTDLLHARAREEYEKDLENKKKWVEIHAQHMAERTETGDDLEEVSNMTGKEAFSKRVQEVEAKWQKLNQEFLERKQKRKEEDEADKSNE